MDNGASSYRRFRENGDESGLVEIIRDYKDGLIFYLTGIVGDIHEAEDLVQDTFVLLGTKKPKDKGKGSFKTWLYTIGRNIAIDHLRKRKRLKETPMKLSPEQADELADMGSAYIREEQKITIHKALRRLKPEYQQILWLQYFEELSMKDCARIMKKSVHGTEMLASRARKALRAQLEQEGFDNEGL
ncbi:RNA polymerase sigma factor [Ruminococcus sp. FC2018]|uniref:RNA polymerase sigma factor n=1 Tax=Ruminococcus sp. FC2018 TaxID=1410617 RepID=UPI00048C32AC|nr:RNA polymerase sigma factor [Ruminococcus sp. FC2018]